MLTSARRREQRARFGALLAATRAPGEPNDASGFAESNVRAAGPFGVLEPDVIALLFGRVLRAGHHDLLHVAKRGDRSVPAVHANIRSAASDVHSLSRTCKYMNACFGYRDGIVCLETAATACTSLAPAMLGSAPNRNLIDAPFYDQFVQEERSRFDVQMLESALLSMVTHCASMHCHAMRRAHNLRIGTHVPKRLEQDVMLRHLLSGQKPIVKVVHTSNKNMWTPVGGIDARDNEPECVVSTVEGDQIALTHLRDEPPLCLSPNSALRRVEKFYAPVLPPKGECAKASATLPSEWRVKTVALSPCSRWIALVRTRTPSETEETLAATHAECALTIFDTTLPTKVLGSFRLCSHSTMQAVWFRQAEVGGHLMQDGTRRAKATILCFCLSKQIPIPLWYNQLSHLSPKARPVGITKVYQYCVEDGSLTSEGPLTLPDWHGLVLKPVGGRLDTRNTLMIVPEGGISDETSIVSTSVPTECRDSFGACLLGIADVEPCLPLPHTYRSLAVQQCVVLDLSYEHRNGESTALLRSTLFIQTLSTQSVTGHAPPMQQFVQLSPRGDLAVVVVQATGTANSIPVGQLWDSFGNNVHILGRRGHAAQFTPLASLDLNQCVHRFRTERALAAALANSDKKPRPVGGHVRIRSAPISRAFSPCGRFLLYGFVEGVQFSRSDGGPQAFMEPPLHADGGMCVFDLSEIWEPDAQAAAIAWIECKADVVPLRMRWTTAGLWLTTRRGPLLLGTSAACVACG